MALPTLHSLDAVRGMFPDGCRPSLRRIKERARATGHCRVLGKSIAFTDQDVQALLAELSPCPSSSRDSAPVRPAPRQVVA